MNIKNIKSSDEYEISLGEQIKNLRIRDALDQKQLAELASISVGALQNLENGKGSSLNTLVKVIRALNKTEWLNGLSPTIKISPMELLRTQNRNHTRLRVYRPRKPTYKE